MNNSKIRLNKQNILITGVSRPMGIGATLAKRIAEAGASVAIHGFSEYAFLPFSLWFLGSFSLFLAFFLSFL